MGFEDLDTGEFENLGGTYGSARDIPELLRTLAEPLHSSDQAADALSRLAIELLREDTWLAEATARTLPFMLELAGVPSFPLRAEVLALVLTIVHATEQSLALPASLEDDVVQQQRFAGEVRVALAAQNTRLCLLLSDGEARVRAHAALLLGHASRESPLAGESVRILRASLEHEHQPLPKVACLAALELLGAYESALPYLADLSFAVRVAAALCLIHSEDPGPLCFDILARALDDIEQTRVHHGDAKDFRPLTLTRTICAAGKSKAVALLPGLLQALLDSSPYQVEETLEPLLATFLGEGVDELPTREQTAVLGAVLRHPAYFRRVAAPLALLAKYGLPIEREALTRLVAQGPSDAELLLPGSRRVP